MVLEILASDRFAYFSNLHEILPTNMSNELRILPGPRIRAALEQLYRKGEDEEGKVKFNSMPVSLMLSVVLSYYNYIKNRLGIHILSTILVERPLQ